MQDVLDSLKDVPSYMLSTWPAIPVFTAYHFFNVWFQENKPESIAESHWVALGNSITELLNFSFYSIYSNTDPATQSLPLREDLSKKISEQRMFEIPGPAKEPFLTSIHPPVMPKYTSLGVISRPLVSFGPSDIIQNGGVTQFAHSSTGYPQQY